MRKMPDGTMADCGHDDWDKPSTFLGEEGTEQFSVTTRVNEEKIGEQKIHDPFVRTLVTLRGFKHAWRALFGGLKIQINVDASQGASRAIMTLNPHQLQAETEKMLEECRMSREAHMRSEDYGQAQFAELARRKGHSRLRWDREAQTFKPFDPHPSAQA